MLDRLKAFFDKPSWAPLTQPLKNVAAFAYVPIREFTEAVSAGIQGERYKYATRAATRTKQVLSNLLDGELSFGSAAIVIGGAAVGLFGAGIPFGAAAFGAMAGTGMFAQVAAGVIGGIAAAGVGAIAGPFLAAGVIAAAGAVVGISLGVVPGIVSGTITAFKHRNDVKNQTAVAAKLPAPQAQNKETLKRISALISDFRQLPKEERVSVVKMLNDEFAAATMNKSKIILNDISTLPQQEKENLVRGLRGEMAKMFDDVAEKDAKAAVKSDEELTINKPLKIVPRRQKG